MATRASNRIWAAQKRRLRMRRGRTASALLVLVVVALTAAATQPGTVLLSLLIISPALWWLMWALAGTLEGVWADLLRGQPPDVRVGRAWQPSASVRQQLRQDANARVFSDRGGLFLRRRHWFVASGTPPFEIPDAIFAGMAEDQRESPRWLAAFRERAYWWFGDAFYWTNADYDADDVKALLFARQRQRERELEHAHAVMAASTSPAQRQREPISKEVKLAVFKRDGGHCVECGSDFDIQYDHIIPFSMGGASTVENLQILCARCNQAKGGRL
jgi:hypothetical protein